MKNIENEDIETADKRKQSHLQLAFDSQNDIIDPRFYYEPMLNGHPANQNDFEIQLGEKIMKFPIWISSMTGGTTDAGPINKILAKSAAKFGLGMGLGSCRIILEDDTYFEDFNLRPILGPEIPFYANIGIAQAERLLQNNQLDKINGLVNRLDADGIIIHVNPLQEWLQPEGDVILESPLKTIDSLLNELSVPMMVKEVGQGFGPESMKELLKRPLIAIDFAANGGTNFSKLELIRNKELMDDYKNVVNLGHGPKEMIEFLNQSLAEIGADCKCENVIISGGVKDFLDGYYYTSRANHQSFYGQASAFLKHAKSGQEDLDNFIERQIKGLQMASKFLRVK